MVPRKFAPKIYFWELFLTNERTDMSNKDTKKVKESYFCIRLGNGILLEKRTMKLVTPKKKKRISSERTAPSFSLGCKQEGISMEYFLRHYFQVNGELLEYLKTKTHREIKIATKDLEHFRFLQGVPFNIAKQRRNGGEIIWVFDRKGQIIPYKNPLKLGSYDCFSDFEIEYETVPDYEFLEEELNERYNEKQEKKLERKRKK